MGRYTKQYQANPCIGSIRRRGRAIIAGLSVSVAKFLFALPHLVHILNPPLQAAVASSIANFWLCPIWLGTGGLVLQNNGASPWMMIGKTAYCIS